MIRFQLQRIRFFAHRIAHSADVGNAFLLQPPEHAEKDLREHFRVVGSTVVIEIAEIVVLCQRIELVVFEIRVHVPGHGDRVQIRIVKRQTALLRRHTDKTGVEHGIVRNQQSVAYETEEVRQHLGDRRCVGYHFVCDAGQLHDVLRDRHAGIDKAIVAFENLAVLHAYRADFRDLAACRGQTSRFNIENNKFIVKGHILAAIRRSEGVVHVIRLHAVEDLDLVFQSLGSQHCHRD